MAAQRTIRLVVVAAVLLVVAVIATALAGLVDDDDDPGVSGAPGGPLAGEEPAGGGTAPIGPALGVTVADYATDRASALEAVGGGEPRVAVVSFVSYRGAAALDSALARAVPDAEVLARLVAAPGGPPAVVEGELGRWADEQRFGAETERAAIVELLPTVTDPEFVASYEAEIARLDRLLATLDPAGEVVFGVVVRADGASLRSLADRADVRLVDPGADERWEPGVEVRGLRPEETTTTGDPPTRP